MRALRVFTLFLIVGGSPAWAQASAAAASCPATPAVALAPFDSTKMSELIGAYDVVMMDTSGTRGETVKYRGRLTLWQQDALPPRRGIPAIRVKPGEKVLAGSFEVEPADTALYWRRMAQKDQLAPGAFWSDGTLRLGEFGSGMGISMHFRSMGATELRGTWNSGSGMGITVDFTGDRSPELAGYYCATRVP